MRDRKVKKLFAIFEQRQGADISKKIARKLRESGSDRGEEEEEKKTVFDVVEDSAVNTATSDDVDDMTLSVGGVGEDEDDSRDSLQVDEDAGNKFGKEEEKHLGIKEEEEQADAVHKGAGHGAGVHRASQEALPDQDAAHYLQCKVTENETARGMCTQEC